MVQRGPRALLNCVKWDARYDFSNIMIFYFHRGAPGDMQSFMGKDIRELGKSFMETSRGMIPYHRVLKIVYKEKVLFQKISGGP